MEAVIQNYVRFLFFMSLYFSSLDSAFCYTTEGRYNFSRMISTSGEYNHFDEINLPTNSHIFNVLDFGAKGDGVTNDAQAFQRTWTATCKTGGVMLIPTKRIFLVQPVKFDGNNCQPNVVVQVQGKILAPNKKDFVNVNAQWILFERVSRGIQIKGNGIIDGRGASWWGSNIRPRALGIVKSANVIVTGIRIVNSPQMHIYIGDSQLIKITNLTINSPGNSPNTDGIHISNVQHANIISSNIACGDDCVSIQTGCSNVKIYDVHCGPGHGYSIGGLGPNGQTASVSDISVLKSTVHDAQNGVRIKTWPGGSGSVHGIVYSGITMSNVAKPIVIDQNYCGGHQQCHTPNGKAVSVYNVSYTGIQGTYTSNPVSLVCSQVLPCKDLRLTDIGITPARKPAAPNCVNSHAKLSGRITPSLHNCL